MKFKVARTGIPALMLQSVKGLVKKYSIYFSATSRHVYFLTNNFSFTLHLLTYTFLVTCIVYKIYDQSQISLVHTLKDPK